MTVGELRRSLTTSELVHWIKMFELYPMGEEAMDIRFSSILARLDGGVPVIQVKKSRSAKFKPLFDREFWTRPLSPKMLGKKLLGVFTRLGMETEKEADDV